MKNARFVVIAVAALLFGLLAGCGGDKSDTSEMVKSATDAAEQAGDSLADAAAEAAAEVEKLSPDDLKAKVDEITEQIMGKEKELKELNAKLDELSPSDLTSDTAKTLQEQGKALTTELESLKEKLTVYTDKLMGDL